MKFGILVFPGSNCDQDCDYVIRTVLGEETRLIWHKETSVDGTDALIIPGGFSYGDYLRTGAIARFSPIMKAVERFAKAGGLVLGICNGFQILAESRLLPGILMRNQSLKYICRNISVRVEESNTPFTALYRKGEILTIPIAHAEGNYTCDPETLRELEKNNQVIFRYSDDVNPNGSLDRIAGICNLNRNVLGMMPHPDRSAETLLGSEDGKRVFLSMIEYLKHNGLVKSRHSRESGNLGNT
ncbi:MAG: phosphoribosylformylglycinamidine synthase subunit PurQ [Nitrospirae bacterium]|nr:phosphoribosylformylglycinamidine synthase subunit PurQ [Nitrospirota bacterium]